MHWHPGGLEYDVVVSFSRVNGRLNVDTVSVTHVQHDDAYVGIDFRQLPDTPWEGKRGMSGMNRDGDPCFLRFLHNWVDDLVVRKKRVEQGVEFDASKTPFVQGLFDLRQCVLVVWIRPDISNQSLRILHDSVSSEQVVR